MRRSEKIKLSQASSAQESAADTRDKGEREAARRQWGEVRKSARESFMAKGDWMAILNNYKATDGFYEALERERMCRDFANELVTNALR